MEGRLGNCNLLGSVLRKGGWSREEDDLLRNFIQQHGEGKWHQVPSKAGLNRCRKSCRLRWLNYLKPNIKRGDFSEDEIDLMIRMRKLLGNRWSLIAGRLPGRTANDVKNYWNTRLRKKLPSSSTSNGEEDQTLEKTQTVVIRPQPRTFTKKQPPCSSSCENTTSQLIHEIQQPSFKRQPLQPPPSPPRQNGTDDDDEWIKTLLGDKDTVFQSEEDLFTNFWVEDLAGPHNKNTCSFFY